MVYDVPDEMAACFDCDAIQCPNEKYETCPNRLAHATVLKAARAADRLSQQPGGRWLLTSTGSNGKASNHPEIASGLGPGCHCISGVGSIRR